MTDIILHDLAPVLLDRIKRVATTRGWSLQETLMHLLEHGLFACEAELVGRFSDTDADALQAAISALEGVPSDPGFSLIGRIETPAATQPPAWEYPEPSPVDLDLLAAVGQGRTD
ncbi:hypothetical protein ACFOLC_15350 [Lysobacter cavernae]|uniref:Uncharacterized protein n=1 Tax=Lysobacter cavernae TaxID=1685901 RepID=A0ABV7RRY9_9GAMM